MSNISMPIPIALAFLDAVCDELPASALTDKIRGTVHLVRHADDYVISKEDEAKAEAAYKVFLSDIQEILAKRATLIQP